jgi:hypothetical protein
MHVIPAKAGHKVKRFSAIHKVKPLNWIPAFAGMTLKIFLNDRSF